MLTGDHLQFLAMWAFPAWQPTSSKCTIQEGSVTKPNVGLLACLAAKPVYGHQVVVKGSAAFISRALSKENGQLLLKRPEVPDGFQGRVLKAAFGVRVAGGMSSSWTFF